MYGAIFGDIIGSRFEFDRCGHTKEFKLFTDEDSITDDTVMTVAVAAALIKAGPEASTDSVKTEVIKSMQKWGHKYPNAGYGGKFRGWLFYQRNPKPYGSYGNGSAMRVSAAGWMYNTLERTREVARATAEVTHNHPEGIKGAECTASVIFLARNKSSKDEIREYVISEFGYDLSESLDELRKRHRHDESCQDALPKALVSFLEGESYEDVVRNAVSLGGDTDTIAAIAGSMAEAFYGIPIGIMAEGLQYIPRDMMGIISLFDNVLGRNGKDNDDNLYENNKYIKLAVNKIYEEHTFDSLLTLLQVILKRILEKGYVPTPMVDENNVMDTLDINSLHVGSHFSLGQDMRLTFDTMTDGEGKQWLPLFTDEDELHKGETTNVIMDILVENIVRNGIKSKRVEGIVINPFGKSFTINKELLTAIVEQIDCRKD